MARVRPDMQTRTITLETQRRSLDLPVDATGHLRRGRTLDQLTVRASSPSEGSIGFHGQFMPFSTRQWIGSKRYGFWESYEPGAITKTIKEKRGVNNDITLNRDHDNRLLLARTSNGTLRLTESDGYGVADADMGDYSYTRDIAIALERRDLTGMSFAFDMLGYEWRIAEDGQDWLVHHEMELYDVSIVGMPANVDTDAALRMDFLQAAREIGLDGASLRSLAARLAEPDEHTIEVLRSLAGRESGADSFTPEPSTPVSSTCSNPHPLALRTLRMATERLMEMHT